MGDVSDDYSVTEMDVPDFTAMTKTFIVTDVQAIGKDCTAALEEVRRHVEANEGYIAGVGFFLYHDKEFNPELMHVEACLPVRLPVPDGEAVKVREVPGGTFARTIFTGPYAEMHPAHIALINYLEAEKLECCGPTREVFLNSIHDTEPKDLKTVIFYPVKPRD